MFTLAQVIGAISTWENDFQKNPRGTSTLDKYLADVISASPPTDLSALYDTLKQAEADNQEALGINIPLGLTAIMGPGSSGKSTWMREIAEKAPDQAKTALLVCGEVGAIAPYSMKATLAVFNLKNAPNVLLVDSWKDIWNDFHFANGILQTGGINSALTATLGLLSQMLFLLGKSLVVVLNPQTAGERETVYQMVNSQCAGMIRLSGTQPGQHEYAQGRMITEEKPANFSAFQGIPVRRASILEDAVYSSPANPMSQLFTKPII